MFTRDTVAICLGDVQSALGLLTRLPLPMPATGPRGGQAAWAWPVAGAVVGGIAGGAGGASMALGVPPGVCAALILAMQAMITGAMHEDGLADTVDGFWGGWTPERRLEIMKDSHIGSYGVLALILTGLARWAALTAILTGGAGLSAVIAAAALSRATMAGLMAALPHARTGGLSRSVGRPNAKVAFTAVAVGLLLAWPGTGWGIFAVAVAAGLGTWGLARIARAKIGGQTGDVLGASQQIAETVVLTGIAALM